MPDPSASVEVVALQAACTQFEIPMRPEWHATALAHVVTLQAAARLVDAVPLEDDAEYGPVFRP